MKKRVIRKRKETLEISWFNIADQYRKCWNYIKESRRFIFSIVLIFIAFTLIGFFVPVPEIIKIEIAKYIEKIKEITMNFSTPEEWIAFILWNNLVSSFLSLILGVVFGIYPAISSLANGYLVGFVGNAAVVQKGYSSLLLLFPHGIFELPAVFISLGLGLKFGTFIFNENKSETFLRYLVNSLRIFFLVVIPLLIIAAFIEGYLIFFNTV